MNPALDDHFSLVENQQAEKRLRDNISLLKGAGVNYIVEGGWAVAAHGSPTPSVDLDILIPYGDYDQLVTAVKNKTGIQLETGLGCDALSLDWDFSDSPNTLFGKPRLSYIPEELLRNRIDTRQIQGVREPLVIRVPRADALVFMKLKAFRDRNLQWTLSQDRVGLAALDRSDAAVVRSHTTDNWERKAGKDLYDICYLVEHAGGIAARALITDADIDQEILRSLRLIPQPLLAFAQGMARRSRVSIRDPTTLFDIMSSA